MIKNLIGSAAIFLVIFFVGCEPEKDSVKPAETTEANPGQQYQLPKAEEQNIEQTVPDINELVIAETEIIQPIAQRDSQADTNKPQITEPNNTQIVEPNQVQNIAGPNEPNAQQNICEIDIYKKCRDILGNYVNSYGKVDYKVLKRNRADLRSLLDDLAGFDPNIYQSWGTEDKIAFWINVYNLQMLNLIVSNYPIESTAWSRFFNWPPDDIRYIDKKLGGIEIQKFIVMNEQFSPRLIERNFLSQQFNEPAAFFALFHGGQSGPRLLNEPYCGKTLKKQLDDQIKRTVSDTGNFRIEPEKKVVYLHSILEPSWYGNYFISRYGTEKDFKDQPAPVRAVLNFLADYLPAKDVAYLRLENYSVSFVRYNWRLDE